MRVRVTNISNQPRAFYTARGDCVTVGPGQTSQEVTISEGTERALFNSGTVVFDYIDQPKPEADHVAALLAKADTMSAAEFRDAASALTGDTYPTKKAAIEALSHGRNAD